MPSCPEPAPELASDPLAFKDHLRLTWLCIPLPAGYRDEAVLSGPAVPTKAQSCQNCMSTEPLGHCWQKRVGVEIHNTG